MKIALFQNMKFGGAMRAAHEIARGLALRGHELHLFRYKFDEEQCDLYSVPKESENPLDFSSIATIHKLPDPRPDHRCLPAFLGWRIRKAVKMTQLVRDLKSFERRAAIDAQAIDAVGCDAVLLHKCCFTNAPLLLKYLETPSLWFCQEPTRDLFETADALLDTGKELCERIYRRKRRSVEITTARTVDIVLCNSAFSQEFILHSYNLSARVCRLGVDTATFVPGNGSKKNQVICWGPLWPAKGLDFIIRSVARLPKVKRPKVVFPWSRGSAAYLEKLERLSRDLDVTIDFPRHLNDKDILTLIQESKICVHAPRMEPLGLVALEAMSAGLPVVGVREGGVRETVLDGKTGYLCERNENEFADRILILLESDSLRRKMSHAAAIYIRRAWTWEHTTERVETLITEIV